MLDDFFNTFLQTYSTSAQLGMDQKNFDLEMDKFEYDKALQQMLFSREDNSVQRRAADLEKAGLSKTLAAGSGAGAGSVVSTTAPKMSSEGVKKLGMIPMQMMQMQKQKADISQTYAQRDLIKANEQKAKEEIQFMKSNNPERLTKIQQENRFFRLTEKSRREILNYTSNIKYSEKYLSELDQTIRQQNIQMNTIKAARMQLENDHLYKKMSATDQEIAQKMLAIEIERFNYNKYSELGLPTNAGMSDMYRLGSTANTATNQTLRKLMELLEALK